ncbi:hypothetical protein FQN57_004377 [Myotisia sp. PD_48]|nr:hypothetical protein FQN57_004377 [Myotisia sp. PD_48]
MPRAEPGTTQFANKQLKLKGLQRLRWFCQVCQRQMRDENGFKQHTLSEGHVRAMMVIGEDPKKWIEEYSRQFKSNFLQLLRTSHGEKPVKINHFYQEYISDKMHTHLNSTRWSSLTDFAKYLGKEGICRVEEKEDGLFIQWIDNSPDAIRRRDFAEKANRLQDQEALEQRELLKQVERAHQQNATAPGVTDSETPPAELSKDKWSDFSLSIKSANNKNDDAAQDSSAQQATSKPSLSLKPSDKPAKKPSVFSTGAKRKKPSGEKAQPAETSAKPLTAIERIIQADMQRKKRKV